MKKKYIVNFLLPFFLFASTPLFAQDTQDNCSNSDPFANIAGSDFYLHAFNRCTAVQTPITLTISPTENYLEPTVNNPYAETFCLNDQAKKVLDIFWGQTSADRSERIVTSSDSESQTLEEFKVLACDQTIIGLVMAGKTTHLPENPDIAVDYMIHNSDATSSLRAYVVSSENQMNSITFRDANSGLAIASATKLNTNYDCGRSSWQVTNQNNAINPTLLTYVIAHKLNSNFMCTNEIPSKNNNSVNKATLALSATALVGVVALTAMGLIVWYRGCVKTKQGWQLLPDS